MSRLTLMNNDAIDEIIHHITKLKNTNTEQSNSIKPAITMKSNESEISDIIKEKIVNDENISKKEDLNPVTVMKPQIIGFTDESTVTCDVCEKDIILGKNLSGLVVDNEFFACEKCCISLSKKDLLDWTKSKMISSNDVRPIGLWVIQQQGTDKREK